MILISLFATIKTCNHVVYFLDYFNCPKSALSHNLLVLTCSLHFVEALSIHTKQSWCAKLTLRKGILFHNFMSFRDWKPALVSEQFSKLFVAPSQLHSWKKKKRKEKKNSQDTCLNFIFSTTSKKFMISILFHITSWTSLFLKSYGISDKSSVVPRVKHFLSGVVIHHGVVAKLVCELYVWVPLFSGLRVVSEIDCSGSSAVMVNGVDHSTSNERISQRFHVLCVMTNK